MSHKSESAEPSTAFLLNVLNQLPADISMSAWTKATTRKTFVSFFGADITNLTSNRVGKNKRRRKTIRDSRHGDGLLSERTLGSIAFVGY